MKGYLKEAVGLYGKLVVATLLCFFIAISVNVVSVGFFSETVGYQVFGVKEGSNESELLYTYKSEDEHDLKKGEFEKEGYTLTVSETRALTKSGNVFLLVATQVLCLVVLISFIYTRLWSRGVKDNNLVRFGHIKEDKLKGFKIGLLANIPYAVLVIVAFVLRFAVKVNFTTALIEFINAPLYSFTRIILDSSNFAGISFTRLLLLAALGLVVPIISGISYIIGYKDISISENILYKKKKD